MSRVQQRKVLSVLLALTLPVIYSTSVYAANPIDLSKQPISVLQSLISPAAKVSSGISYAEISRSLDARGTLHARIQQQYQGHSVWGGDAIVHIPNGSRAPANLNAALMSAKSNASMDGMMYQDLTADLVKTPAYVFTPVQAEAAFQQALALFYKQRGAHPAISDKHNELMVYIDKDFQAHWAYNITFYAEPLSEDQSASKPIFIMDAISFKVYENWDNLQTVGNQRPSIVGGGFGGNLKMGRLTYDGTQANLASLNMTRDYFTQNCFLNNDKVTVRNYNTRQLIKFRCKTQDTQHPGLYWDGDQDAVNGGYSPANDALFGGAVITNLYQQWYGIPVLTKNGKPMMLEMVVHKREDNASWNGREMTFGDGIRTFYPLTSLGVAAHEISHGFTEQHSNLRYRDQSGGMNEAYSDMAAQAAEVFAYGKNSWQIGPEIFKVGDRALRYMDVPSKDCFGGTPGKGCSIDKASQYTPGLNVHLSSGVYNRAFYLLAVTEGWNVRKAFDVFVTANMHYWTSQATFVTGACGAVKAANQLGYDKGAVKAAFTGVGISTEQC